jgi:hypothetical protein
LKLAPRAHKALACLAAATTLAAAFAPPVLAAEGMWTLDNLPRAQMQQRYGFTPDAAWVDTMMRASARLAGGCSASFISPDGLVMTNHHCITRCVEQLSTAANNRMAAGFLARTREDELRCPGMELNRLEAITDVTGAVRAATAGLQGAAFQAAQDAVFAKLTSDCRGTEAQTVRCDMVTLYRGGLYQLYKYHRFSDVRLAWAPEEAVAAFGGDPDNFNFPRFCLDIGLLRVYEAGKPAAVRDFFRFKPAGAEAGELVFSVGTPGMTQRQLTVAQLEALRDSTALNALPGLSEIRGYMLQLARSNDPDLKRLAMGALQGIENGLKVTQGRLQALMDPALLERKRETERTLQAFVATQPDLKGRVGDPWADIARAQRTKRNLEAEMGMLEEGRAFGAAHFQTARTLVRGAVERSKPNGQRLREFNDSNLPQIEARLRARVPVSPAFETARLSFSLNRMRSVLGADAPLVRQVLGKQSPEQLAQALVAGSKLGDLAERQRLWDGGLAAVQQSDDPFVKLVLALEPQARALRARYEAEVASVEREAAQRIAVASFAQSGTSTYPDATFSLRVSYGDVQGWLDKGKPVPPFTTIGGLFERATGAEPFALPASWLAAQPRLDMAQRMNFVATLDTIGGNSGSPVLNRQGQIVGLLFDGNLASLGDAFYYDETDNRSVMVHPGAIVEALRKVYKADGLLAEMLGGG